MFCLNIHSSIYASVQIYSLSRRANLCTRCLVQNEPSPEGEGLHSESCVHICITFLHCKNNGLQQHQAPSPAGEGWGEENKINCLYPLIPAPSTRLRAGFSLKGEGAPTFVDTHAPSGEGANSLNSYRFLIAKPFLILNSPHPTPSTPLRTGLFLRRGLALRKLCA